MMAPLLIDNAPSHPYESELITEDGNIMTMFMTPNETPLIQPTDQNAIKITKMYYRSSLLASIAAKQYDLLESMKKLTLNNDITFLEAAWNRVGTDTLAKCWKNILNIAGNGNDPDDDIPLVVLKERWDEEIMPLMGYTVDLLHNLNPMIECPISDVQQWNEDLYLDDLTDNQEIEFKEETDNDDCTIEATVDRIGTSEAIEVFNRVLEWAGDASIDQDDMNMLIRLREKAVFQLLEKKTQQKKITDFFNS